MTIDELIDGLAQSSLPNVFNPYQDLCPLHDKPNAPELRRKNLKAVLASVARSGVHALWVGRDLGYRGGRRTGIPLTDDLCLKDVAHRFGLPPLEQPTKSQPTAERTASVVWTLLSRVDRPVMFWNVFPFHPHPANDPLANRAHTARERREASVFLEAIITLTRPTCIVAIGRDAEAATSTVGVPVYPVRHPSFGGQRLFENGIAALYSLSETSETDAEGPRDLLDYAATSSLLIEPVQVLKPKRLPKAAS